MIDVDLRHMRRFALRLHRRLLCALIAVCLPWAAAAKIADTSSVPAALSLVDAFDTICAAQVEGNQLADKSDLVVLTQDQIAGLSAALGYRHHPEAIWSHPRDGWYQVQTSLEAPQTCLFVSFAITLDDIKTAWDTRYTENAGWRHFSDATITEPDAESGSNARYLSGAFAFRRFEDRIIMAGVAGRQFIETGVVLLRYQKTKATRKVCELDPEACR